MAKVDVIAGLTKNGKRIGRPPKPRTAPVELTAELLRQLLHYDPATGVFTSLVRRGPKADKGTEARTLGPGGYLRTRVFGKFHMLHRLAWLYVHGVWPKHQIDHINGVKADNRMINLRDVDQSINQQNRPLPQRNNTTGYRGVFRNYDCFCARITLNKVPINLGRFKTAEEASRAYTEARERLHPGYVRP